MEPWVLSCALTVAALRHRFPGTLVVVCAQHDKVEAFLDDLEVFHREQPLRFPAWESILENAWSTTISMATGCEP